MVFNINKSKEETLNILKADIGSNEKYVASGYKIAGDIKGDKLQLQLNDDYGRHSSFLSQVFYGNVLEKNNCTIVNGSFRPKNSAVILLVILLLVAIESLVSALIISGITTDLIMPVLVIAAEIFYVFMLKRMSAETNGLIEKYLNNI